MASSKQNLLFNTVLFGAIFSSVQGLIDICGSALLKGCLCENYFTQEEEKLFTVNCTNVGFLNTDMLEALPAETEMLIFTGNHIPILDINIFGDFSHIPKLKYIDMSNNGIREIKGKAFHHVEGVQRLILNHNNISISKEPVANFHHARVFSNFVNLQELHLTNAFADNTDAYLANDLHDIFVNSNLNKLYKLHLEQNEIKNFKDEKVFCDLPNLHDLYIGDNNIPSLNFDISCLKKLRFLDLEDNNITRFSQKDLEAFDKLAPPHRTENLLLEIGSNPFRCDSAIKNMYNWIQKTHVKIRNLEHLECHQNKYGKKYIMNLRNLAESKHAKFSQSLTVLMVVLSCVVLTLFGIYAYFKKERLQHHLSPLFNVITRKVHYTTIESEPVDV